MATTSEDPDEMYDQKASAYTIQVLTSTPLEILVPHSRPMLLLDDKVEYRDDRFRATVTITEQSMFYESDLGGVPAYVGIEYMAQSIGLVRASIMLEELKRLSKKPSLGLLLSCRNFQVSKRFFRLGDVLEIYTKTQLIDKGGLNVFDCFIEIGGEIVSTVTIKAMNPQNLDNILDK